MLKKKVKMPEAYLSEMALNILKEKPYLVAGHPSTVGAPCPKTSKYYLRQWSFVGSDN